MVSIRWKSTKHNPFTAIITDMQPKNLYKPRVKTNTGKKTISFIAVNLWKDLPDYLKFLKTFSFIKKLKDHLLTLQRL